MSHVKIVVLKKRSVWGARCAREDNIKMYDNTAECEGVKWIELIHNGTQRLAFNEPACSVKGGMVL
jgi:hypothetical protein